MKQTFSSAVSMIYRPSQTVDNSLSTPGRFCIVWVTGRETDGGYIGRNNRETAEADLAEGWIWGGTRYPESKIAPFHPVTWWACEEYNRRMDAAVLEYDVLFSKVRRGKVEATAVQEAAHGLPVQISFL